MKSTIDKLAEALRALVEACESSDDFARNAFGSEMRALDVADEALSLYDAERAANATRHSLPAPHNLTAREWVERARDTLGARKEEDDAELIDAHDDLCNALEVWT